MRRTLRIGGLTAIAIAIPVVVASATYAIGVRSLAPTTRLEVSVSAGSDEHTPQPARSSPDDHDGRGSDDNGGGTSGGSGSTSGGSSPTPGGDDHGGKGSGSDDRSGSGSGSGSSGSGSGGSGSGGGDGSSGSSGHGGGDD